MQEKIIVSVLVTFYNQKKYVDKALSSIIEQKNCSFEIIVGDDGSNDGTIEEIKKWINQYPTVISLHIMPRMEGKQYTPGFRASQNRLNLLQHVKGEYFIFLDGDDYFSDNEKLYKQVKILENKANLDCNACGHNITALYPNGVKKDVAPSRMPEGKYTLKKYWGKFYVSTDTLLIRSKIIDEIPVEIIKNDFNDNTITFVALQTGKLYYIPESMAIYVQTGDGIWTANNLIVNNIRNIILYDICQLISPQLNKETDYRFFYTWLMLLIYRHNIKKSDLEVYLSEARKNNYLYTNLWINYNNLKAKDKILLLRKFFKIFTNTIVIGAGNLLEKFSKRK